MPWLVGYNVESPRFYLSWYGNILVESVVSKECALFITVVMTLKFLDDTHPIKVWIRTDMLGHISNVNVIFNLLYFFLVFYLNTAYKRWWESYMKAAAAQGRMNEIGAIARASVRSIKDQGRIVRYAHLTHHMFYMNLAKQYEWETLLNRKIVTRTELEFLKKLTAETGLASIHNYMYGWLINQFDSLYRKGEISFVCALHAKATVQDVRRTVGWIVDANGRQMPMSYLVLVRFFIFFVGLFGAVSASIAKVGEVTYFIQIIGLLSMQNMGHSFEYAFANGPDNHSAFLLYSKPLLSGIKMMRVSLDDPVQSTLHLRENANVRGADGSTAADEDTDWFLDESVGKALEAEIAAHQRDYTVTYGTMGPVNAPRAQWVRSLAGKRRRVAAWLRGAFAAKARPTPPDAHERQVSDGVLTEMEVVTMQLTPGSSPTAPSPSAARARLKSLH